MPASLVDSFTYDSINRLTAITVTGGGSSSNYSAGEAAVTLSYSGSNLFPGSYTLKNSNGSSSLHQLNYDGQNRIIEDTAMDGTGLATYWSSFDGNIVSVSLPGSGAKLIDTFFFQNGNVVAMHSYAINNAGAAETFLDSIQYTYTTVVNPCYHQAMASTYGPLLNNLAPEGGFTDFVSGYGISRATSSGPQIGSVKLPGAEITESFAWSTDSQGRAAALKVTEDSPQGTVGSLTFSYR